MKYMYLGVVVASIVLLFGCGKDEDKTKQWSAEARTTFINSCSSPRQNDTEQMIGIKKKYCECVLTELSKKWTPEDVSREGSSKIVSELRSNGTIDRCSRQATGSAL